MTCDVGSGTCESFKVPAVRLVESFLAARFPATYGYLGRIFKMAAEGDVQVHYDHFLSLSAHACGCASSPFQNMAFLGCRGEAMRPDTATCS